MRPRSSNAFLKPHSISFWLFVALVLLGMGRVADALCHAPEHTGVALAALGMAWAIHAAPVLALLRQLEVPEQTGWVGLALGLLWGTVAMPLLSLVAASPELPGGELLRFAGFAGVGVVLLIRIAPARFNTRLTLAAAGVSIGLGQALGSALLAPLAHAVGDPSSGNAAEVVAAFIQTLVGTGLWQGAVVGGGVGLAIATATASDHSLHRRLAESFGAFAVTLVVAGTPENVPGAEALLAALTVAAAALLVHFGLNDPAALLMARARCFVPEAELIADSERQTLETLAARREARRAAARRGGKRQARTLRRLQRAQLAFLAACDPALGRGPWSQRAEEAVRDARWVYRTAQGLP